MKIAIGPAPATQGEEVETSSSFVLEGVPWLVYRALRALPGCDGVRMTYLDGTLCLMSPEYIHEGGTWGLGHLLILVALAHDIDLEPAGATTLRRRGSKKRRGAGKEPDTSFYVGVNAERMRWKEQIRLPADPPPDLAIEIDNKGDSTLAMAIYARLRVPEVWRHNLRRKTLWFGRLEGSSYVPITRSLAFPMLTPPLVLHALQVRGVERMRFTAWSGWVAEWARTLSVLDTGDQPGVAEEGSP